ncbi:MAG: ADP-ribosylglycohydrolase family protein [bacterium]
MNERVAHARGALLGLAVGDALGRPTEGKSPAEIKQRWGRVQDFLSDQPAGTDDTEYALFAARLLLRYGFDLTSRAVAQAWREEIISETNDYKGAGFSEMLTIANLKRGLQPPQSGRHLHSWSDGLAMRAAPYGIAAAGNPTLAARLAQTDGEVSHAGEGIYGGRAVAAAVALAMTGADCDAIFAAALDAIPEDSWCYRAIHEGVFIGRQSAEPWQALEHLHATLACHYYHWSDLAPEAVGLAFGVLAAADGNFETSVLGGVNVGRDTDTIAAIAGAIAGAKHGIAAIPAHWTARIQTARGACIKTVQGMDILSTAEALAQLAAERSQA